MEVLGQKVHNCNTSQPNTLFFFRVNDEEEVGGNEELCAHNTLRVKSEIEIDVKK